MGTVPFPFKDVLMPMILLNVNNIGITPIFLERRRQRFRDHPVSSPKLTVMSGVACDQSSWTY